MTEQDAENYQRLRDASTAALAAVIRGSALAKLVGTWHESADQNEIVIALQPFRDLRDLLREIKGVEQETSNVTL